MIIMRPVSLMYHDVREPGVQHASGFPGRHADRYKLPRTLFEEHLKAIQGVTASARARADRPSDWPADPVFLTFDDGGVSAWTLTAALLEHYGWRGHFFITTDYIGRPGFCSPQQIIDLRQAGHVIGSHSRSHPTRMSRLTERDLHDEWSTSRTALSAILCEPVTIAALPGGYYSWRVGRAVAAAGFRVLFTSEPTRRVRTLDGCAILGRYTFLGDTPSQGAAELIAGRWWPRTKAATWWNVKKAAKLAGGGLYVKAQRRWLEGHV